MRSIQIVRWLSFALLAAVVGSVPAFADQAAYDECFEGCRAQGSLSACFYNCNSYLERPGPPPPPPSDLLFGAIAFDERSLKSGYAKDASSREAAEAGAIAECRKVGGSREGCKILLSKRNSCMALAVSRAGSDGAAWGWAYSDDGSVSRREATKTCKGGGGSNCQVVISFCTG